jgi:hypothetical protein
LLDDPQVYVDMADDQANNRIDQLVEQLANLVAAMNQDRTGQQGGTAAFALTPGHDGPNEALNWKQRLSQQVWRDGIQPLSLAAGEFHTTSSAVNDFKATMSLKAVVMNWNPLFLIPNCGTSGEEVDLLKHPTKPTVAEITASAQAYISGNQVNSRKAQDNYMCCLTILASCSKNARARLYVDVEEWNLKDGNDEWKPTAPLLFRTLILMATSDNKATEQYYRDMLRNCWNVMVENNYDVIVFNTDFLSNYNELKERGKEWDDAITTLFEVYRAVPDHLFSEYFKTRNEEWLDDKHPDLTVYTLTAKAASKYNYYKQKGTWGEPSPDQKRIIALTGEVNQLSKVNGDLKLAAEAKSKQPAKKLSPKAAPFNPKGTKTKNKKSTKDKQKQKKDEAWKKVPPSAGQPSTKTVDGRTYQWCIHHMAWTIHSSKECKLGKERIAEQSRANSATVASSTTVSEINYLASVAAASHRDE